METLRLGTLVKSVSIGLGMVVAIVTIILATLEIEDRLTAPSSDLVAEVHLGPFKIPPGINEQFSNLANLSDELTLREQIDLKGVLDEIEDDNLRQLRADRIYSEFSFFLRMNLPSEIHYEYQYIYGYWDVQVQNVGTKAVQDAILTLPRTMYVLVEREGETSKYGKSSQSIQLGEIQPREEVQIFAWTEREPSVYLANDIKLTHSEGVGKINLDALPDPTWQWPSWWGPMIIGVIGGMLAAAVILLLIYVLSENEPKPQDIATSEEES